MDNFIIGSIDAVAINIIPTGNINTLNRIVPAVSKHVIAEEALAGGDEGVGVEEAADGGVVITAL